MSPKVRLLLAPPPKPRLTQWGDVFFCQGGGEIWGGFDDEFYAWWGRKVPAFKKLPYAGLYFCGDPELIIRPGGAWGEMGEL